MTTSGGEPEYAIRLAGQKDTNIPYYLSDVRDRLSPGMRTFLKTYSGIYDEEVADHVQDIRDQAWAIRAYPCIGLGVFLQPPLLHQHPYYQSLVHLLGSKQGARFADIGTFLGIDIRYLYQDLRQAGMKPNPEDWREQLFAIDIVDMWELGFKMFRDNPSNLPVQYVVADALSPTPSEKLSPLIGSTDVINIAQVLHQFRYDGQIECCKTLVNFSHGFGSAIIGNQVGYPTGRKLISSGNETWQHGPDSWKEMWDEVGKLTQTEWNVSSELRSWEQCGVDPATTTWLGEDCGLLFFTCIRVS